MEVYTIGFTQKTARQFFEKLKENRIERLIDVRLNNVSQLAGFSKKDDLPYFLEKLSGTQYIHEPLLAPTQELLDRYKKLKGDWKTYEKGFLELMQQRQIEKALAPTLFERRTVLLCSEATAQFCHRRLVLEYLNAKWGDLKIANI